MDDVAAGKPDIMQVAFAPLRQFAPIPQAFPPDMNGFLDLRPEARTMMIYHRLV